MPFFGLNKLYRSDALVFFDFEATQFSQKAISIGVVIQKKKVDSLTDFIDDPVFYSSYIQCDDKIGKFVSNLTGIDDELLSREGKSFHQVIIEIATLLRKYHKKNFLSYSNSDMRILYSSIDSRNETELNFAKNISKYYFDFASYLSKRIVDKDGNSLSLMKFKELYNINLPGHNHNALFDSMLLKEVYFQYIVNEELSLNLVLDSLLNNKANYKVAKQVLTKVMKNEKIDRDDLIAIVRDYL